MQQYFEKMLARIVVIGPDKHETKMGMSYLKDRIKTLRRCYDSPLYKNLKEHAYPHYIDVEHPVAYLEYCLQLEQVKEGNS